jgi:hypothetical protein
MTNQLDAPAKDGSFDVLVMAQGASLKNLDRVDDGHAPVQFTMWDVMVEILERPGAG